MKKKKLYSDSLTLEAEEIAKEIKETGVGFACGPKKTCPDGSEHDYSIFEELEGGGTAVCAKCGHRAIDDAWWY